MKAVQRLGKVGFPNRGSSGNGLLSNLKSLKGHANGEAASGNQGDIDENGALDGEVRDDREVTVEPNAQDEQDDVGIKNIDKQMAEITVNGV